MSVLVAIAVWWWYFDLRAHAKRLGIKRKWMFRRQLIISWAVTLLALWYLIDFFMDPSKYGETTWL